MSAVPEDTGIDVGRPAAADAVLAVTLLAVVVGLGLAARVRPAPLAVVAGAGLTLVAEGLAYQDPGRVRAWWERQPVRVAAIGSALVAITAGIVLAPDRSVSLAVGALSTYLLLLGLVSAGLLQPPERGNQGGDHR